MECATTRIAPSVTTKANVSVSRTNTIKLKTDIFYKTGKYDPFIVRHHGYLHIIKKNKHGLTSHKSYNSLSHYPIFRQFYC